MVHVTSGPLEKGHLVNRQPLTWSRVLPVLVLLGATGLLLRSRGQAEVLPARQPLTTFPLEINDWQGGVGKWQGAIVQIPDWALEVLGSGEFAERYFRQTPEEPGVDLFMAYFPSQRMGSTMHSPQNCLPGSGWTPVENSRVPLSISGKTTIIVNRYIVAKGDSRLLVYYWYQEHGRVVASEYWSKFYLVADSIRFNRSDGALVRVSTPIAPNEPVANAETRTHALIASILPILDRYIPR
jgi:EpsI family protein